MPTPSEQKALAFFAIVILLGGAARVVRAGSAPEPSPAEQQALAGQARAVETAGKATRRSRKSANGAIKARSRRDDGVDTVAGVTGVPFSDVRPDPGGSVDRSGWVNGFPPPLPRIDIDRRTPGPGGGAPVLPSPDGRALLDLDVATVEELDARLPGVGPALAARLVANRDSFGPFRSLEGLRRVKGMGPATVRRLATRVTFSGRAASSSARSRY